ncbi:FmdB family zinc ribbon protein [Oligoflexus tunisiensis]|uniref:FmdB family zinc ribbon protein n=1 Tax=Oligoflexus tunisiensis TaxID=708132 RepID=UPI00114D1C2B|nr:zinc ribbon domain-containing protein [Oligoflexus tunisiensis]
MPLYEFRCGECAKISEFQLKMSDPSPTTCPVCGQGTLTKIMSLPAFQLKGSGWYKDAYDGKSNKKPESTSSSVSESTAKSPEAAPAAASPAPAPTKTES